MITLLIDYMQVLALYFLFGTEFVSLIVDILEKDMPYASIISTFGMSINPFPSLGLLRVARLFVHTTVCKLVGTRKANCDELILIKYIHRFFAGTEYFHI